MSYDEAMATKRSEKNAEIRAKQEKIKNEMTRSQSVVETRYRESESEIHDPNSLTF